MKMPLVAASCFMALCGTAHANLITNGSFEDGTLTNPSFTTVNAGQNNITGWTVNSGSVDYIGSYWQAADGSRSLDMSGNNAGTISQSFATTIGQKYLLTFDLAGNPDDTPSLKTLSVDVGVASLVTSFQTVPGYDTESNMHWQAESLIFTADSSTTTLSFASDNQSAYGPALDNVGVSQVPLPPALPMFGGALLALGAYGYMRRRRGVTGAPVGSLAAV